MTRFQELMAEIRRNIIQSSRSRDTRRALDEDYFCKYPKKQGITVAEILREDYSSSGNVQEEPGSQIERGYEKPFDKYDSFGKKCLADSSGGKAKGLIYWFKDSQPQGNAHQVRSNGYVESSAIDRFEERDSVEIYEILHETSVDPKIVKMKRCLAHINGVRLQIKKREFEVCFFQLKDHFHCITKNSGDELVKLDKFYETLRKVRIIVNRDLFEFLLNELSLIDDGSVYFEDALNLLNWKYNLPSIDKTFATATQQ